MRPIRIRRLNDEGLRRLAEFLDSQDTDSPRPYAEARPWLEAPSASDALPGVAEIDPGMTFPRRFDLAAYLYTRVPRLGLADPVRDTGLWAWLGLAWFEQLAPIKRGKRLVGERARWIPEKGTTRRLYRHLCLGPYVLYQANADKPERALIVLVTPPHQPGELVGQLAANGRLMQCHTLVEACTRLYIDPTTATFMRGAGGSGAGSPRRLVTVADQFDRTFDLHSMTSDGFLSLLPLEFHRFKERPSKPSGGPKG